VSLEAIQKAKDLVKQVYMDENIQKYIIDIVFASRYPERYQLSGISNLISFGGSPRASINIALASKAHAFMKGRAYVVPEDIRLVVHDVMRHRIGLTYEAQAEQITQDEIITQIINKIDVP
jgi:MoxR-like ATPase